MLSINWVGKRYFAIARSEADGHSFSFSKLNDSPKGNMQGGGCERPCADIDTKVRR